jgi:hypothetical protein
MSKDKPKAPLTDLLRRTVTDAIESGQITFLGLQQQTGLKRASMTRFVTGKQSIRLDLADKLAVFFGLELRLKRRRR